MEVSVIVPVYNAEAHLERCIASLRAQTLEACEFIFVNDGSTDGSRRILERHAALDDRIVLIDQPNRGVSAARNAGLDAAIGRFVGFVDADDEVAPEWFETLREAAERHGCDAVIAEFAEGEAGRTVSFPFPAGVRLDRDYIRSHLLPNFVESDRCNAVWNKLYRMSAVRRSGARFPNRVALGEDGWFNMLFFAGAESAVYLNYCGYRYRETEGGATRRWRDRDYFARALEVYHAELPPIYAELMDERELEILRSAKLIRSVLAYIYVYCRPAVGLTPAERLRRLRRMIDHRDVRRALEVYRAAFGGGSGRYERIMLELMSRRSALGVYCAATWSRLRNGD
ncbi:glycosyltransferase [Thermobacillus sp. ZCTH02-B1]|uniref:glycosyltransferase family 2 protein n=1 Tax=Thermobacillus sp. ZCTH02-B1 TaxID=1858795 RepID=UPI0025D4C828|nr:glycosyltransferase [Thermobacillus sp. ZCTH02-B1]